MNTRKKISFCMYEKEKVIPVTGGLLSGSTKNLLPDNNELASMLSLMGEDVTIFWVIKGDWTMHQLLIGLLNITGAADVVIATYAMCETSARIVAQLKNGNMIRSLSTILDNRVDVRSAGSFQLMTSMSDRLVLDEVHAKVTVIYNENFYVAVIGSANYTENNRYEAGVITTNIDVVKAQLLWMNKALANGKQ